MKRSHQNMIRRDRRAFLKQGTLVLAAAGLGESAVLSADPQPVVKFGFVTDLHYADKPPSGSRHYRETPARLEEAAAHFHGTRRDFVVETGRCQPPRTP